MDWLKDALKESSPAQSSRGLASDVIMTEHSPTIAEVNNSTPPETHTRATTGIKKHMPIVYGICIGILILVGATVVANKLATSNTSTSYTWGTEGGVGRFIPSDSFDGSLRDAPALPERFTLADLYRTLENSPDRFFAALNVPRTTGGKSPTATTTTDGEVQYDESGIEALLASLRPSSYVVVNPDGTETDLKNIYNYIPTSIVGTTTLQKTPMTEAQRKLHAYGLEAGQPIESYFTLWGVAQAQVFKNLFEDRTNAEKISAAKNIARALFDVGTALESVYDVPSSIKPQHDNLAASYKDVGRALIPLINTKTDAELLTQIETYNTLVDKFARNYLAVVAIFSANQITYEEGDPGRVFIFTPGQFPGGGL